MTKKVSEKQRSHLQQASKTHGIYAFRDRGEDALTAENAKSLYDLRELVKTNPGRQELRQELAARVAMIVWMGFAELQKAGQAGELWNSPVIQRAGSWVAELRRLLDSFQEDGDIIDAEVVLGAMSKGEVDGSEDTEVN